MKPSLNLRGLLPLVSLSIARCSDIIDPHLMTRALQKWTCAASTECGAEEYCASGICRSMGTCGQTLDCFNPSNFYWKTECVGTTECMDGVCGVECGDSFCPNSDEVNCLARPCETTTCNQSNEFCVDNYCGGCNAIFFDAAGRQVCRTSDMFADEVEGNETKAEFVNETTTSCSRDNDCNAEHYCSSGSCRAFGTCGELVDCFNPGNIYPVVLCVGPSRATKWVGAASLAQTPFAHEANRKQIVLRCHVIQSFVVRTTSIAQTTTAVGATRSF